MIDNKVYVNVGSSHYCVKNFINYDNHIFLRFVNLPKLFFLLFKKKYHALFSDFLEAHHNYVLKVWNCKKWLPHQDGSIDHILCSNFLEHVYETEAEDIIRGFYRKIRPGGTLHILLPNLDYFVNAYLEQKNKVGQEHLASDQLNFETILTHRKPPTLKFRILELMGGFGLKHYRMYNEASANLLFTKLGFVRIPLDNNCPSYEFGRDTVNNIHLLYKRPLDA